MTGSTGIFVNVVDMVDACTRAGIKAKETGDAKLESAAKSVMSACVFHLGKRHVELPGALREHYEYLIANL